MNSYVFAVDATRSWWHLCDAPPPYALSAASQSYLIHCFLVDACDVILFSVRRYVFVLEILQMDSAYTHIRRICFGCHWDWSDSGGLSWHRRHVWAGGSAGSSPHCAWRYLFTHCARHVLAQEERSDSRSIIPLSVPCVCTLLTLNVVSVHFD